MVTAPRASDPGELEVPLATVLISLAVPPEVPAKVIDPPPTLLLEEIETAPLLMIVPPV